MKKFFRMLLPLGIILLLLGLLALVGWYRSYVDKTLFITAFDKVATAFFGGVWVLLQITTIQISLVIFLALYFSRDYIQKYILPRVRKLSAGGAEIEFTNLLIGESASISKASDMALKVPKYEVLCTLIDNFPDFICWYLIKIHNRPLPLSEFPKILNNELSELIEVEGHFSKEDFGYGLITALNYSFRNIIFNVSSEVPKNPDEITFLIYPEALDLIKKKLKIE